MSDWHNKSQLTLVAKCITIRPGYNKSPLNMTITRNKLYLILLFLPLLLMSGCASIAARKNGMPSSCVKAIQVSNDANNHEKGHGTSKDSVEAAGYDKLHEGNKIHIVMVGAPASGKGTHAARIRQRYSLGHISVGDVFRREIKEGSYIGQCVKDYVSKGMLIDDKMVMLLLKDELSNAQESVNGMIFDGFPRTITQAQELEKMSKDSVNIVVNMIAADDELIERVRRRALCGKCNAKLVEDPACAKCVGDEVMRDDDDVDVFKERLRLHHMYSDPIVEYLRKSDRFKVVDVHTSGKEIEDVSKFIFASLDKAVNEPLVN